MGICKRLLQSFVSDHYFHCRIGEEKKQELIRDNPDCKPSIQCQIENPYNNTNSLLMKSQCVNTNISFWLYLFARCIADIFVAAAVTLLNTAVVIATRETSTGRGDIGKQLAAAALGFSIFPPLIGGLGDGEILPALICYTVLIIIAVLILIFDR